MTRNEIFAIALPLLAGIAIGAAVGAYSQHSKEKRQECGALVNAARAAAKEHPALPAHSPDKLYAACMQGL